MIKNDIKVNGAKILVLGITFKENCPDVRNTKVVDVIRALESYSTEVTVYDPWANPEEVRHEYGISCLSALSTGAKYDAIMLAVAHHEFQMLDLDTLKKDNAVVYDVKGILVSDVNGKL